MTKLSPGITGALAARPRGLRRLRVTPEVILSIARGRYEVRDNPLPADARWVRCQWVERAACFEVVVESEEFGSVAPGDVIPEVDAARIFPL